MFCLQLLSIIAFKASGRDCTNNNELLHKIGVLQCYAMRLFVFTRELLQAIRPGRVAQSVTCLATDACLTADPGVASSIPVRYHTFVEIDYEIISTVILLLPLIYSRRVVVSYKRKYVHKLLVNRLPKPPRKKCG